MWRSIISSIGAAVTAVGSAVNSALGAISGGVLFVATALAPKPPTPAWHDAGGGVCPGGQNWRGPFPTRVDADEYRADIPVPTSIHRFSDGWWVSVDYESTVGERA